MKLRNMHSGETFEQKDKGQNMGLLNKQQGFCRPNNNAA
jgi:hypothetical protein